MFTLERCTRDDQEIRITLPQRSCVTHTYFKIVVCVAYDVTIYVHMVLVCNIPADLVVWDYYITQYDVYSVGATIMYNRKLTTHIILLNITERIYSVHVHLSRWLDLTHSINCINKNVKVSTPPGCIRVYGYCVYHTRCDDGRCMASTTRKNEKHLTTVVVCVYTLTVYMRYACM